MDVSTLVYGLPCLGTFTELIRRGDVELTMKHMTFTYYRSATFNTMDHSVPFLILGSTPLKDTRQCRVSHEDSQTYSGRYFPTDSGKVLHLFRLTV
jgi:hypothetical protein